MQHGGARKEGRRLLEMEEGEKAVEHAKFGGHLEGLVSNDNPPQSHETKSSCSLYLQLR